MRNNEGGTGYEYSQKTRCQKKKKKKNANFKFEVISVVAGWQSSGIYTPTF